MLNPQKPAQVYDRVGGAHPRRSLFDLSHEIKLTCDYGQLIPVLVHECVPGDFFELSTQSIVRTIPMVAPLMHELNIYFHYFFVPHRVVCEWAKVTDPTHITFDWTSFITGGRLGTDAQTPPVWWPVANAAVLPLPGTIWDYLGFPTGESGARFSTSQAPDIMPLWAYQMIYDNFYRDENLIDPEEPVLPATVDAYEVKMRAWEKDYFTSALLTQQRGTAPAFPITGTTSAIWPSGSFVDDATPDLTMSARTTLGVPDAISLIAGSSHLRNVFNGNTVDLSSATTFNVADLRLNVQIQRWMERNMRCGVRLTEFIQAHYDVHNGDSRLQRPEYIGGTRQPIITSEVLQTSATVAGGTPQGTMAGHGISADRQFAGKYHCKEHGTLMCIMSIMPRTGYQQGMPRQQRKTTRLSYYFPEFAHLSEQVVTNDEVYYDQADGLNGNTFGFQGRYDEYRTVPSRVSGLFKSTFNYWHLNRIFASRPSLNDTFVECDGTSATAKRVFAAGTTSPGFMVQIAHLIKAFRPLPPMAEPGLMDHN